MKFDERKENIVETYRNANNNESNRISPKIPY